MLSDYRSHKLQYFFKRRKKTPQYADKPFEILNWYELKTISNVRSQNPKTFIRWINISPKTGQHSHRKHTHRHNLPTMTPASTRTYSIHYCRAWQRHDKHSCNSRRTVANTTTTSSSQLTSHTEQHTTSCTNALNRFTRVSSVRPSSTVVSTLHSARTRVSCRLRIHSQSSRCFCVCVLRRRMRVCECVYVDSVFLMDSSMIYA